MANTFNDTVSTLFKGMDGFMSTKTVVGEPMHIDGTIIIPLADVSFGVGAGVFEKEKNENSGGGLGGKIQPTAVLVIRDGSSKLISLKTSEGLGKILDMVPDLINKFTSRGKKGGKAEKEASEGFEVSEAAEIPEAENAAE